MADRITETFLVSHHQHKWLCWRHRHARHSQRGTVTKYSRSNPYHHVVLSYWMHCQKLTPWGTCTSQCSTLAVSLPLQCLTSFVVTGTKFSGTWTFSFSVADVSVLEAGEALTTPLPASASPDSLGRLSKLKLLVGVFWWLGDVFFEELGVFGRLLRLSVSLSSESETVSCFMRTRLMLFWFLSVSILTIQIHTKLQW